MHRPVVRHQREPLTEQTCNTILRDSLKLNKPQFLILANHEYILLIPMIFLSFNSFILRKQSTIIVMSNFIILFLISLL